MSDEIPAIANPAEQQMFDLLERVREVCMDLLDSARFSTWRDCHLKGDLVTVSILARPDATTDTCRISVVCNAAGNLRVEWGRVPLELLDTKTLRVLYSAPLGARGMSTFVLDKSLLQNPGTREHSLRFRHPAPTIELEFSAQVLAIKGKGANETGESSSEERLPEPKQSSQFEVALSLVPDRTLRITITARDPSFERSTALVEIRSKQSGEVVYSEKVRLELGDGKFAIWDVQGELLNVPIDDRLLVRVQAAGG